jgi:hypothetical protein
MSSKSHWAGKAGTQHLRIPLHRYDPLTDAAVCHTRTALVPLPPLAVPASVVDGRQTLGTGRVGLGTSCPTPGPVNMHVALALDLNAANAREERHVLVLFGIEGGGGGGSLDAAWEGCTLHAGHSDGCVTNERKLGAVDADEGCGRRARVQADADLYGGGKGSASSRRVVCAAAAASRAKWARLAAWFKLVAWSSSTLHAAK